MQVYGTTFTGQQKIEVDGVPDHIDRRKRSHVIVSAGSVTLQARTMKGYERGDRVFFQLEESDLIDLLTDLRVAKRKAAAEAAAKAKAEQEKLDRIKLAQQKVRAARLGVKVPA